MLAKNVPLVLIAALGASSVWAQEWEARDHSTMEAAGQLLAAMLKVA